MLHSSTLSYLKSCSLLRSSEQCELPSLFLPQSSLFLFPPKILFPPKVLFFHSIEIVIQGHSASSLKCSKHNVYAKLLLKLYRTMDVFSRLPFLNWHFKTLMKFFIVHGTAFLEVFVTGEHFIFTATCSLYPDVFCLFTIAWF